MTFFSKKAKILAGEKTVSSTNDFRNTGYLNAGRKKNLIHISNLA